MQYKLVIICALILLFALNVTAQYGYGYGGAAYGRWVWFNSYNSGTQIYLNFHLWIVFTDLMEDSEDGDKEGGGGTDGIDMAMDMAMDGATDGGMGEWKWFYTL